MKHEEFEYEGFPSAFQEMMKIQHEAAQQGLISEEAAQENINAYVKGYLGRKAVRGAEEQPM